MPAVGPTRRAKQASSAWCRPRPTSSTARGARVNTSVPTSSRQVWHDRAPAAPSASRELAAMALFVAGDDASWWPWQGGDGIGDARVSQEPLGVADQTAIVHAFQGLGDADGQRETSPPPSPPLKVCANLSPPALAWRPARPAASAGGNGSRNASGVAHLLECSRAANPSAVP